tara:strand:- start:9 stop:734 length:726 start_codon:yes stop_codon:yes gene_type:complete
MNYSKKWFITFGAGGDNYIDAGNRLITQIQSLGLFDKTILYTENDLMQDSYFWEKHKNFILNNKRGYGYWLWKSYIIKKTLDIMNENDILLYLDCGCEVHISRRNNMCNYFEYVKEDYIIGCPADVNPERQWTKRDLFDYLNMNTNEYLNSVQQQAGALLLLKNNKVFTMVTEWYNISCNYHLIDDTPSLLENTDDFKEHRHDQSIYSLLLKKYNIRTNKTITNCVEYIRNRTGISRLRVI